MGRSDAETVLRRLLSVRQFVALAGSVSSAKQCKTALGPAAIEAMSKAFDEACIAREVYAGDEKGREIIGTRIDDLAPGRVG
jgi:hypothetical protein